MKDYESLSEKFALLYQTSFDADCGLVNNVLLNLFQLTKCMKDYESLSEKFALLYQTSFDADPHTLHKILLYPLSHSLMEH